MLPGKEGGEEVLRSHVPVRVHHRGGEERHDIIRHVGK